MHKLSALKTPIIKVADFAYEDSVKRMVSNVMFSAKFYLSFFDYLIRLKNFEISRLPFISDTVGLLSFRAKHPNKKVIKNTGAYPWENEGGIFTVLNTMEETEFYDIDFIEKEKNAWEVIIDSHCRDISSTYK